MIVANVAHAHLRTALLGVAHPEEDVVTDSDLVLEALDLGYPRLLVEFQGAGQSMVGCAGGVPVLVVSRAEVARWTSGRGAGGTPGRIDTVVRALRPLVERRASPASWVDRTLADLSKAAGAPLPPPLRAFARRVLEFPSHYDDLHPLAGTCDLSRGALKARFRRRGLGSPYAYLRWFRIIACAHVLSDRRTTVAQAAHRLGFTSDGNLCRTMNGLTGMTPTEVRAASGAQRLRIAFAREHLRPEDLDAWRDLGDLFARSVA